MVTPQERVMRRLKTKMNIFTSFLILAFAKKVLKNKIGSHSKTSGFYPTAACNPNLLLGCGF